MDARPHADSDYDEIGVDRNAVVEPNPSGFDGAHRVAEMEHDAMTLVQLPYEIAELRPQYALHRPRFGCHDMDLDLAMTQRGGRFESNEAGADHDGMSSPSGASNQVATVGERAARYAHEANRPPAPATGLVRRQWRAGACQSPALRRRA